VSGGPGLPLTIDVMQDKHLRRVGAPLYSSAVAPAATEAVNSSLGMVFNGPGQSYTNAIVSTARNNFGIEAWVIVPTMPVNPGNYYIAMNGNPNANGWGLGLAVDEFNGPFYFGLLGGVTGVAGGRAGRTAHLALVRDNGVSTFYVNGRSIGTNTAAPIAPAGRFVIGGGVAGLIDEVRVFTFAAGQFTPDDLLLNQRRAVTAEATDFAPGRATLNGTASTFGLPTDVWFEWGTTPDLGNVTPPQALDSSQVTTANFSQPMTGLVSGQAYFFRAASSNALGVATGVMLEFTTGPTVQTLAASNVTATSALLSGVANPKGTLAKAWFEWGITTNYGDATPPQTLGIGSTPTNFSDSLTNLFAGGTFHYRAVLSNVNEVVTGTNRTFTTPVDFSVTRAIAGTVLVTIQPPEAVADGARWTLDNGPALFSEVPQGLITPSHHTVRARNLPNWREPAAVDVYVVGGKTSQVSMVYTPIPSFDFHDVPEQHARPGEPLEFIVTGTPSPSQLQVTTSPAVTTSLTFDPASGRVTYIPSPDERLPFTLTFTLAGAPVATTTITPLQSLPPEDVVINYDRPLPDDESRDYITISEIPSAAPVLFNGVSNTVLTVDISGKTLVFGAGHTARLLEAYNDRKNIQEFRLYADRVIIRSPLVLPQTHVTIRARELRFEGDGVINTTPLALHLKPPGISPLAWSSNNFTAPMGFAGHNGGDADVFVERFFADATTPTRFILTGGKGGPPGEGRQGYDEGVGFPNPADGGATSIPFFPGDTNWAKLMLRAGNSTNCGFRNGALKLYEQHYTRVGSVFTGTNFICGDPNSVARGEPGVSAGLPGTGGRGGMVRSTLDLSGYVSQAGGPPGDPGTTNYLGGTLFFQYIHFYFLISTVGNPPQTTFIPDPRPAPKVRGNTAINPSGTNGPSGGFTVVSDPAAWLHSFGLRAVTRFAKDAYLNGRVDETRKVLDEYLNVLRELQPVVPEQSITNLTDAEFAEATSLDQLVQEMSAITTRIDMNLDFFGNPAGWVPMLSFEANLAAYQDEITRSIPILYLAYWMNYSATNLQNSAAASLVAAQKLREEFGRMVQDYNDAETILPSLRQQSGDISRRILGLRAELSSLETQLVARAQQNVEDRHKLPFWKKALGVLSVAADLVPVGQPTVGRIGAGLATLAKIDLDHPVQSALSLTNAFDFTKNKDIRLCFSGSATNGTNTSSVSTNSPAKKRKLKLSEECGKFLQAELKEIAGVFKEVQVDSKELQAEIEKLKASDVTFQRAVATLTQLNKDKESIAATLMATLQALATLTSEMNENNAATDDMDNRAALQLAALDHNALVHIKEMERRAFDRLLKFQYFTAKAFQYRLLRPFPGNFQLNRLFERFQAIVAGADAHVLSQPERENLKQIYEEDLANTVNAVMAEINANAPSRELPRSVSLTAEELRLLNTTNQLVINFAQRLPRVFPNTREDLRIVNLRVAAIRAHPVGGALGEDALLFLDFNHLGESRVSRNGQNFRFRHYQSTTVSPIGWSFDLDLVNRQTNNSVLSASSGSLLKALLTQPTDANMLLFSRPAADADILIRRGVLSDNGIDLVIDSLTIEVEYEFVLQSPSRRTLDVQVRDGLQPIIVLNQTDVSGRRDGQGDFRRVYPAGLSLTLQAPAIYGGRPFDRWVINDAARPAGLNSVTFTIDNGTTAEAVYAPVPSIAPAPAPELAALPPAPGLVGFRFSTVQGRNYVIERKFALSDPAWTPVETMSGTGGLLQFTRPTTTNSSFFRLRVE
jgi:hypothetical protein